MYLAGSLSALGKRQAAPHQPHGRGQASIGGEVWFGETRRVYLSGSSGRYPPDTPAHLEDAEALFRAVGFDVVSLGWDREIDRPQRVWREQ